jgi:tRNA(His) 5'-end guanylyltransferase
LRQEGKTKRKATSILDGMSKADKNEFLFQKGINYNELPNWQKRGVGLYWQEYQKVGHNPISGEDVIATRSKIYRDLDLPMKDDYSQFIRNLIGFQVE